MIEGLTFKRYCLLAIGIFFQSNFVVKSTRLREFQLSSPISNYFNFMHKLVFLHQMKSVQKSFRVYEVNSLVSIFQIIDCLFFHQPRLIYPISVKALFLDVQVLILTFIAPHQVTSLKISLIAV